MKCKNCKNLTKRIDSDGILYDSCEIIVDCPDTERERDCKYYTAATNADRIRSMSDKELAEFLTKIMWGEERTVQFLYATVEKWNDWLKQEADI